MSGIDFNDLERQERERMNAAKPEPVENKTPEAIEHINTRYINVGIGEFPQLDQFHFKAFGTQKIETVPDLKATWEVTIEDQSRDFALVMRGPKSLLEWILSNVTNAMDKPEEDKE